MKRPANVDSQTDRNSPVVPETSLTGRPENDEERRVVTRDRIDRKCREFVLSTAEPTWGSYTVKIMLRFSSAKKHVVIVGI